MAFTALTSAPVLSTPDTHIFEAATPAVDTAHAPRLSDEQLALTYEIARTVREIRRGRWSRVALQFPDCMLGDAPRVVELLGRGLEEARGVGAVKGEGVVSSEGEGQGVVKGEGVVEQLAETLETNMGLDETDNETTNNHERLFILGDTSYGACCVDEVAAEHVDADCVVHYGRSCLSPPSRLPVIYVFTAPTLDLDQVVATFETTYPDRAAKVILMADIPFAHHIPALHSRLHARGYTSLFPTEVLHNPSSLLPNRTVPPDTTADDNTLQSWSLFHVSAPPDALLLTLSSRVAQTHIYPTTPSSVPPAVETANTRMTLRRRYALCTSLSTTPVFGILINTLSVQNYMAMLAHVQRAIAAAGKKSYTFVVGKVNAAKIANFSEIGGWVVIGCWESSLIESKEFWRPIITPFELAIALKDDGERVWTGEWKGDFGGVLDQDDAVHGETPDTKTHTDTTPHPVSQADPDQDQDVEQEEEEEDSTPPEFDLRTGRYVSHSRPMASSSSPHTRSSTTNLSSSTTTTATTSTSTSTTTSTTASTTASATAGTAAATAGKGVGTALTKRTPTALTSTRINGVVSPGAEYLRSKRTWVGLGSDYHDVDGDADGAGGNDADVQNGNGAGGGSGDAARAARMEEGRRGIARGYRVGGGEGARH